MPRQALENIAIEYNGRSPAAEVACNTLAESFGEIVIEDSSNNSLIVAGGIGFGDFNPESSDVDTWVIMRDRGPRARLEAARRIDAQLNFAKAALIEDGQFAMHNFRHPATILSERESVVYRRAFAAKIGLPILLGVFPTIAGADRQGEQCFTEDELAKDLAYSCNVFRDNLRNPPANGLEGPTRYCYKRSTYFLRFQLLHEKGLYVPRQKDLLEKCEEELPDWQPVIPYLRRLQEGNTSNVDLLDLQAMANSAMSTRMERFCDEGLIDELQIIKGGLRTQLHWTQEKVRWDYLMLDRNDAETLRSAMSHGGHEGWGFSFDQISNFWSKFCSITEAEKLARQWEKFASEHTEYINGNEADTSYYDEEYHPALVSFFDAANQYSDKLF